MMENGGCVCGTRSYMKKFVVNFNQTAFYVVIPLRFLSKRTNKIPKFFLWFGVWENSPTGWEIKLRG